MAPTVEVSLKDPRIGSKNSSERKIENVWSEDYRLRHKIHVVTNYILTNVIYYFSYTIQLFFMENLKQLLEKVSINICLKFGTIKFFVILRLSANVIEINKKPNCLDSGPMTGTQKDKLKRVLNFCRLFSLSTMVFYEGGSLIYPLATTLSQGKSLENWVHYDWRKNAFCCWGSLLMTMFSTVFQLQLALVQEANDPFAVLYLCVLSAHLQIMERFANIHYDSGKTGEEIFQHFMQCLEDHRIIME